VLLAFFLAGGFPMVLILLFGLVAVGSAARFAWLPEAARLGPVVALSAALVALSTGGVAACLLTVATRVTNDPEWSASPDVWLIVLAGFGESLAPAVLGSAFVAATALLSAVGLRRLPRPT
jgi:hypothetical protein